MKTKLLRIVGISLFLLGTFLFVVVGLISTWGDFEALFFNAAIKPQEPLKTLNCPIAISTNEIGTVSASFHNTDDDPLTLEIRAFVTDGFVTLMTEYDSDVYLEPDEVKSVEWIVTADDAAYDRLILVRVHQMKESPLPYMNASCGIVVVNVPFLSGTQFIILLLFLGVVLTSGGLFLWACQSKPIVWGKLKSFRGMIIFAVISCLVAVSGLLGFWGVSIIATVVWVSIGIGLMWQSMSAPKNKLNS